MGIRVECPHGHVFKVKDKYAGKKGLCPHCEGQVIVLVPDATTTEASEVLQREAIQRRQKAQHASSASSSGSHVFDDPGDMVAASSSGTSGSLLGSLVGSFVVGFLYNFGQAMFPELAYVVLFLPMLVVLVLRPQGLFGRQTA